MKPRERQVSAAEGVHGDGVGGHLESCLSKPKQSTIADDSSGEDEDDEESMAEPTGVVEHGVVGDSTSLTSNDHEDDNALDFWRLNQRENVS